MAIRIIKYNDTHYNIIINNIFELQQNNYNRYSFIQLKKNDISKYNCKSFVLL